ncbi:MAG TPA: hypothetical protein VMG12_30685 [Polyangiaceae bacterium]|nr:hypothetical protein [Polyangiaceae bacterium]
MRSIVALGVVSLAVAAGMVACGDDSSDDGPALGGTGGTSGGSGGGGTGGTAGGGAGGTAGGGAGGTTGGTGGTGGAAPTISCTGCVELTLPIVAGERNLGFQFNFTAPAAPLDLSNSTVTWKVQVLPADANANFFVQTYAANAPPEDPNYTYNNYANYTQLTAANFPSGMWVDIVHNIGALDDVGDAGADSGAEPAPSGDAAVATLTAFDNSVVRAVGIQIGAAAANTATGTVRLLVDSVTFTNATGAPAGTFTVDAEGLTANNYLMIPGVVPPTHH